MPVINLTKSKEPDRVLRNACKPNANPRGTWIVYHTGDYSDSVNQTKVGRAAWELAQTGVVLLCQKLLQSEPRQYAYVAVVL